MSGNERLDPLTPREREVLALLQRGLTNEEIAGRLGITLDGAKYHVSQILSKLGVSSREEAATLAEGRGAPWRSLAGAAVVAAAVAGLVVLAWTVWTNERDEGEATPLITPSEIYERVMAAVAEPGTVIEVTETRVTLSDRDIVYFPVQHWFYYDGQAARTEIRGADETGRSPTDRLGVGTRAYVGVGSGWTPSDELKPCPGTDDMLLSFVLQCHELWTPEDPSECPVIRDVRESEFGGSPTVAIDVGATDCPSPAGVSGGGSFGTLHLDPDSYLPLAWRQTSGLEFRATFEYDTIAAEDVPEGFFDPEANTGIRIRD